MIEFTWSPAGECYLYGSSMKDRTGEYVRDCAHGYITIAVLCEDEEDVEVARSSVSGSWFQWEDRKDMWYSGGLDYVGCLPAGEGLPNLGHYINRTELPAWLSIGDNRAFAVLTLPQFLQQLYPIRHQR